VNAFYLVFPQKSDRIQTDVFIMPSRK